MDTQKILEIKAAIYDNIAAMEAAKRNIAQLERELQKARQTDEK